MDVALAPGAEEDEALAPSRGSLAALLVPGRLEPDVATQISVADGSLCGVRPRVGWKPGKEPAFSADGLERLMTRQGLAAELAAWKLSEGQRLRAALAARAQPAVVVDVDDEDDAERVVDAAARWMAAHPTTPVIVELPEAVAVGGPTGRALVATLRNAGAAVAVQALSGDLAAVRTLRRVQPRYVRLDARTVLDVELEATSFRMTALVAAAEGWPVAATGLRCRNGVAFARRCGVTIVEGHARRWRHPSSI